MRFIVWESIKEGLKTLLVIEIGGIPHSVIASIFLIILGIIYFGITLWIIKIASEYFFGPGLDANFAVLSAAILAVGGILAGALD